MKPAVRSLPYIISDELYEDMKSEEDLWKNIEAEDPEIAIWLMVLLGGHRLYIEGESRDG